MGSYSPRFVAPREEEASIPMDPVIIAASSERMSPKMLEVRTTSNCEGFFTSCMAVLSTSISVSSTSG